MSELLSPSLVTISLSAVCVLKMFIDVWSSCRYRWWLIAAHPALGRVLIPQYPASSSLTVRDLMPYVKRWPDAVEQQLRLAPVELDKFQANGQSLRQFLVKSDQKLPTALHSWGGQVVACACGCRDQGFSDALLSSKGLYGQLLQIVMPDGVVMYRHLHAVEVAILCGVPPCLDWSDNERLNLCAIGQLAAPMHSVWIGASIVRQKQLLFTRDVPLDPNQALHELKSHVHAQSKVFFGDIPKSVEPALDQAMHVLEIHDGFGHTIRLPCSRGATVRDLICAEADLLHVPLYDVAVRPLDSACPLDHGVPLCRFSALVLQYPVSNPVEAHADTAKVSTCAVGPGITCPTQLDPMDVGDVIVPDVPCPDSAVVSPLCAGSSLSLLGLTDKQLQALLPPLVSDASVCTAMRCHATTVDFM